MTVTPDPDAASKAAAVVAPMDISTLEKGAQEVTEPAQDRLLVTFTSPASPATTITNPREWSSYRKVFTAILTSFGGLVTLMSSIMLAPALGVISDDLGISEAEASMAMSIYVLGFGFGPMVLAPCSEVWGRKPIWVIGGSWFCVWNVLGGLSRGKGMLITSRLMAGLGASSEFAVSGPIMADIWDSDERGKSQILRGALPLLGPAIGPMIGGVMVQHVSWHWLFYVVSIFNAVIVLLFIFFLPETYAPTLLQRKALQLRKSTGEAYYAGHEAGNPKLGKRLKTAMVRPLKLLAIHPAIQLTALFLGLQFGILYIVHTTLATMWTDHYRQSATASGLHYFSFVIGCITGLYGGGKATDRLWAYLKAKNEGRTSPENRIPLFIPGLVMVPMGLLCYGWAAEKRVHWVVPDIGIAIFGCGYIVAGYAAQTYVVDAFLDCTASAGAASQFPRNMFAFGFPVFAPSMFKNLGYGMGNTVLAVVSIVVGLPVGCILWIYGKRLRDWGNEKLGLTSDSGLARKRQAGGQS